MKRHYNEPINNQFVEDMIARGHPVTAIARHLRLDRTTLYKRREHEPELMRAFTRGEARRQGITKRAADAGEELTSLLREILADLQNSRHRLAH